MGSLKSYKSNTPQQPSSVTKQPLFIPLGTFQKRDRQPEGSCSAKWVVGEQRRQEAMVMRQKLHKMQIESNVKRLYVEKERRYKVWKARTLTNTGLRL